MSEGTLAGSNYTATNEKSSITKRPHYVKSNSRNFKEGMDLKTPYSLGKAHFGLKS